MNIVFILNLLIIIGMVVSATLVLLLKKPLSCVISLGVTGVFAGLEFILLQAPDVAIAEVAVGAVLTTVLYIVVLKKTIKKEDEEK